ncbi:MAG: pyridoxamine 5'-phosphate oxidase, partial [Candidatus Rokuibacteriota bacterium]
MREPLPEILPADPLPLVAQWFEEARPVVKTPTAMALATVAGDGRPTVRMVICRGFDAALGWFVFYSDRESAKGRDLAAHPRAALVFHWDVFERQIRVEGPVTHAPEADSDRYWSTRPLEARVAAAASDQSRPIASRQAFLEKIEATKRMHGADVPRPPRWGGYRVWAERVELWVGQPGRAHDRAGWTRALQ